MIVCNCPLLREYFIVAEDSDEESSVIRVKEKKSKGGIFQKTNTASRSKANGGEFNTLTLYTCLTFHTLSHILLTG